MSCDRRPNVFGNVQEDVHDLWIKLTTREATDRFSRGLERRSTSIGPVGCDGIESVRNGEYPRAQKNLFPLEDARVASASVLLVVHENDFGGAASVKNCQAGDLGGQLRFAVLGEKLPKLVCRRGERVGEGQSFFSLLVHGNH